MRYRINLRITYEYDTPTRLGRQVLHVLPRDLHARQRVSWRRIDIDPRPVDRCESVDFFGNPMLEVGFEVSETALDLDMEALVDVTAVPPGLDFSPPFARLSDDLNVLNHLGPDSPLHFVDSSPRIAMSRVFTDFAHEQVRPGMTVLEQVRAVGQALHREIEFVSGATEPDTPPGEAFARRRGVCQDFSHIMIGCLRGIGVPAGYVSGFLRTVPPKGQERLEGADAMHAWVRAWCGIEMGWVEYDPTNALDVAQDHVVVAWGRDYSDVSPLRGVTRTSGKSDTGHTVDMVPLAGA